MSKCSDYLDLVIRNEDAGAYTTSSDMRAIYERGLELLYRNNCRKELLTLVDRYSDAGRYTTAYDRRRIREMALDYIEKMDR
jgi:hypothetical protein